MYVATLVVKILNYNSTWAQVPIYVKGDISEFVVIAVMLFIF